MYKCYRVISSPRLKACSMGDRHSQLCHYESRGGGGGGTHDFFARVVSLYGLFFTLSGIFDEKVGLFSEFLCLLEVQSYPKYDFEGCFGEKKMAPIFKPISKIVDFFSELGESNQSIQSSFALSFVPSK